MEWTPFQYLVQIERNYSNVVFYMTRFVLTWVIFGYLDVVQNMKIIVLNRVVTEVYKKQRIAKC